MAEKRLSEGMLIICETDKSGRITFANEDFLTMSGHDHETLRGTLFDSLRHPDMPEVAYEELWKTIEGGKVWNGLVCSRCENGDYCWSYAMITPSIGTDGTERYLFIGCKPTREEMERISEVY